MNRTFNIPPDIVEFLKTKDNQSAYIVRLIRQDMDKDYLERKIKLIIRKINREEDSKQ